MAFNTNDEYLKSSISSLSDVGRDKSIRRFIEPSTYAIALHSGIHLYKKTLSPKMCCMDPEKGVAVRAKFRAEF